MSTKYGPKAQETVHKAMRRYKHGTLKSGGSGRQVTTREQAVAIGLSEARAKGQTVPAQRAARRTAKRK